MLGLLCLVGFGRLQLIHQALSLEPVDGLLKLDFIELTLKFGEGIMRQHNELLRPANVELLILADLPFLRGLAPRTKDLILNRHGYSPSAAYASGCFQRKIYHVGQNYAASPNAV
ncbi:hypothetical protein WS84_27790 [Burkholderia anthina]|nr:hypothetical protein WS84_27790 [Burkholderia anthina]